jgi:YidC/Oxa1 family membrane protein insertase
MLQENALDYFDTIFCYGPNHIREVREMERVYGLPPKTLVRTGFPLLDTMIQGAEAIGNAVNDPKVILIAPSWQQDNILEYCLDETLRPLLGAGYRIVLRPHPEFIKRFPGKMRAIEERYKDDVGELFEIQTSFASSETVYSADLVITDWSSIANEFSYATKKPSLFINTPMKVVNPNYEKIPLVPLDISLRDEIGISVDVEDLDTLPDVVRTLLGAAEQYKEHIAEVVRENIFDVGDGARGGGQYIIDTLAGRTSDTHARSCDDFASRWRRILDEGRDDEIKRILSEPLLLEKSIPMTKGELMMDVLEELEHSMKGETSDES